VKVYKDASVHKASKRGSVPAYGGHHNGGDNAERQTLNDERCMVERRLRASMVPPRHPCRWGNARAHCCLLCPGGSLEDG
jgi:hypothetical protein